MSSVGVDFLLIGFEGGAHVLAQFPVGDHMVPEFRCLFEGCEWGACPVGVPLGPFFLAGVSVEDPGVVTVSAVFVCHAGVSNVVGVDAGCWFVGLLAESFPSVSRDAVVSVDVDFRGDVAVS